MHSKVFGSRNLDLDPLTIIYELDLCPQKLYLHAKTNFLYQYFQSYHITYMHTYINSQTDGDTD